MALFASVITIFVTVFLFIAHRVIEWKFERERFLRSKLEELSIQISELQDLVGFPEIGDVNFPEDPESDVVVSRAFRRQSDKILADERKCSIIVRLHFPQMKCRYRRFDQSFSPILGVVNDLILEPNGKVEQKEFLAAARKSRKACYEILNYIEDNCLELTGNWLGR